MARAAPRGWCELLHSSYWLSLLPNDQTTPPRPVPQSLLLIQGGELIAKVATETSKPASQTESNPEPGNCSPTHCRTNSKSLPFDHPSFE